MGSSTSTNQTDGEDVNDLWKKTVQVASEAAGTHVGSQIGGPGGAVIGRELGKRVLAPAVLEVSKGGAGTLETSHGTIVFNSYGSTFIDNDGNVIHLD